MKTLRACICDDDSAMLPTYQAAVKGCFQGFGISADVDFYSSVTNLKNRLNQFSYDIIFLDIDMPGEDGITFASLLRKQKNSVPIVFVSAREDRMFDAFVVQPFGFVRKSKFLNDLNETVRLFVQSNPELTADMVIFSTHMGGIQVNSKQIIYIESRLHNQYVYINGQPKIELRLRMEDIQEMLADKGFIRVHKGYIVNYRYIKKIINTDIELTTGEIIPLSRAKKKEVKALWLEYGTKNGFICIDGTDK